MDPSTPLAQWAPELSVHEPALDQQHQGIIATLGHIQAKLAKGAQPSEVLHLLNRLEVFMQVHFAAEEAHMAKLGFPGLAGHQAQHQFFLERLAGFQQKLGDGVATAEELARFVHSWFVDHIRGEDARYASLGSKPGV